MCLTWTVPSYCFSFFDMIKLINMPKEYSREELWKLYEKLPKELKEAIFAEETANAIYDICTRNEIEDDRISEIARYTGRVLMGILPPDEFQETLEKELKLEKEVAKRVAREIFRFIFYPVRPALEELYKTEIGPTTKPIEAIPGPKVRIPIEKKPKEEQRDIYREPIE